MRFAYSTINWGADCDLEQAVSEIAAAGWRAVELFGHSLDLLGTPSSLRRRLGGLEVATLFGSVQQPFHTPAQVERPHTQCTIEVESELDRVLEQAPRLRVCLDTSHTWLVGEDPLTQLRKYRGRMSYVHLKDWRDGHFVGLGDGGVLGPRWPELLRELEDFDGWVVVEQSRSEVSPARSARENAEFLTRLGQSPAVSASASVEV